MTAEFCLALGVKAESWLALLIVLFTVAAAIACALCGRGRPKGHT
jgi:hypothetical protein